MQAEEATQLYRQFSSHPTYISIKYLISPSHSTVSQSQQSLNSSSLYFLIVPALPLCHHWSMPMQTHDSANMSCYEASCRSGSNMHLLGPCGGSIASRRIFILDLNETAGQTAHNHEKEIFVSTFSVSLSSKQTDGDMKSGLCSKSGQPLCRCSRSWALQAAP